MMSRRRTAEKKKKTAKTKSVVAKSIEQKVTEAVKNDSEEIPNLSQDPKQENLFKKKK